jgi:hypothetical protein
MAELEIDKEEVAEIESCDQEYLNELKTSLAEQRCDPAAFQIHVVPDTLVLSAPCWMGIEPTHLRQWRSSRG